MPSGVYSRLTGYHNRRSIRLRQYDYARSGYYFVTICAHDRKKRPFADVFDGGIVLNDIGKRAQQCWLEIPHHFPGVVLDEFVVMPNHVHGIIVIHDSAARANNYSPLPKQQTADPKSGTSKTIGSIVRGYKIGVTKYFNAISSDRIFWQRNYYDQIIHDDKSLFLIRKYIRENPSRWAKDSENHVEGELVEFKTHGRGE